MSDVQIVQKAVNDEEIITQTDNAGQIGIHNIHAEIFKPYTPIPREEPEVRSGYLSMATLRRPIHVYEYQLRKLLYAVDSDGAIQAWWKVLLRFFFIVAPALLVILSIFSIIALIAIQAALAAENMLWAAIYTTLTVIIVIILFGILKASFNAIKR